MLIPLNARVVGYTVVESSGGQCGTRTERIGRKALIIDVGTEQIFLHVDDTRKLTFVRIVNDQFVHRFETSMATTFGSVFPASPAEFEVLKLVHFPLKTAEALIELAKALEKRVQIEADIVNYVRVAKLFDE